MAILFYDKDEDYGVCSNFYHYTITLDGKEYMTTEHYFQAQKFAGSPKGDEYAELIRSTDTPAKAKYMAGQKINGRYSGWYISKQDKRKINDVIKEYKEVKINPNWNSIRDNIMRKCCYEKFKGELKEKLLETGDNLLVEHTKRDKYWADGGSTNFNTDGSSDLGQNMLGRILVEIRTLLSGKYPKPPNPISNWLIPNFLLISRYPELKVPEPLVPENIPEGIDVVINLMEQDEEIEYLKKENIEKDVIDIGCTVSKNNNISRYNIRFPIPDRKVVSDAAANEFSNIIMSSIGKHLKIMIHCQGGKGRTGTIAGIVLGKMFGLTFEEAYLYLNQSFASREIKGEKCNILPQTKVQKMQLSRLLAK